MNLQALARRVAAEVSWSYTMGPSRNVTREQTIADAVAIAVLDALVNDFRDRHQTLTAREIEEAIKVGYHGAIASTEPASSAQRHVPQKSPSHSLDSPRPKEGK